MFIITSMNVEMLNRNTSTSQILVHGKDCNVTHVVTSLATQINFKRVYVFTSQSNYSRYQSLFNNVICYHENIQEEVRSIIDSVLKNITMFDEHTLIIIDNVDCDYNTDTMRELILNGRCYNISMIFASLNDIKLRPELRLNMDYLILAGQHDEDVLKKFWNCNDVDKIISSESEFVNLYEVLKSDNKAFVLCDYKAKIFYLTL